MILSVNDTEVNSVTVSLSPKETKEINFVYKAQEKGNYTVEILGQKRILEVKDKEKTSSILMTAGIITIILAIGIYLYTKRRRVA